MSGGPGEHAMNIINIACDNEGNLSLLSSEGVVFTEQQGSPSDPRLKRRPAPPAGETFVQITSGRAGVLYALADSGKLYRVGTVTDPRNGANKIDVWLPVALP